MKTAATLIAGGILLLLAAMGAPAQEPPNQVHVVLFVPAGVRPPAGCQQRIDDIVTASEAFLRRELRRWGHDRAVMPFRRKPDGHVEVTLVRGKQATSAYKPVAVRVEVMNAMRAANRVRGGRQNWWIMVYPGDPPKRFAGFLGGFGPRIGGWAVCNLDTTPGRIDPEAPLGSGLAEKLALKGMLNEMGHGFQLPHIGPLDRDRAGNTLMGPTHANYRRVRGRPEERIYLSEAEAAILATHPAFRGGTEDPGPLPTPQVEDLKYAVVPQKRVFLVSGRVRAAGRAGRPVYALVGDESDARPGEYWTKTYAGKVAPDGSFQVMVSEPAAASGTLRTWFVFENGAQTGNGTSRGRGSGIAKAYAYAGGRWTF